MSSIMPSTTTPCTRTSHTMMRSMHPCATMPPQCVYAPPRASFPSSSSMSNHARRTIRALHATADDTEPSTPSTSDAHHEDSNQEDTKTTQGFRRQHPRKTHKWYAQGELVVGKVIFSNQTGAKIRIYNENNELSTMIGWLPAAEGPYLLRAAPNTEPNHKGNQPCIPRGLVREFVVVRHEGGKDGFRGPLLSARSLDWDMLWRRAEQLLEISRMGCENLTVRILDVNSGGLLAHTNGLRLFIPVSHLERTGPNAWWSEQELYDMFVGRDLEVAVVEVDATKKKLVGSVTVAKEHNVLRKIKVGALVEGTVRRVEPFGAFVGLDGTHNSGLIHISNVSRAHVGRIHDVFRAGDKVKAVVMAMDEDYTNISLSTAELEVEDGDMIDNPGRVWEQAEQQLTYFQEHIAELQQELREAYEMQLLQEEEGEEVGKGVEGAQGSVEEDERSLVGVH